MKRKEIERRWELETKKMTIPTAAEIMKEEGLTREEASKRCIIICGNEHKKNNIDCHRKINGYNLCDGCPKYAEEKKPKVGIGWEEIQTKIW
jgi:hypothetical protein